ncbi:Dual specificity protein phosphatase [uncultured virus]|nr:Dual specificity protein phosphatase [uncultured virus]
MSLAIAQTQQQTLSKSPLLWTVMGSVTAVTAMGLFAIDRITPTQLKVAVTGAGTMFTPAFMNWKKTIVEFSFINTVVGHKLLNRSWYNEIIPGKLTLSAMPLVNYGHVEEFAQNNIQLILTTLEPHEWEYNLFGIPAVRKDWNTANIQHEIIETPDFEPMSQDNIMKGVEILRKAILEDGKNVCVHCKAGRARSATVVICYLLKHGEAHGIPKFQDIDSAITYVAVRRPVINLNVKQRAAIVTFFSSLS